MSWLANSEEYIMYHDGWMDGWMDGWVMGIQIYIEDNRVDAIVVNS